MINKRTVTNIITDFGVNKYVGLLGKDVYNYLRNIKPDRKINLDDFPYYFNNPKGIVPYPN